MKWNLFLSCALFLVFGSNVYAYTSAAEAKKISAAFNTCISSASDWTESDELNGHRNAGNCVGLSLSHFKGDSMNLLKVTCLTLADWRQTTDNDPEGSRAACFFKGGLYLKDYLEKPGSKNIRQFRLGLVLAMCTAPTPKNSTQWEGERKVCVIHALQNSFNDAFKPGGFADVCIQKEKEAQGDKAKIAQNDFTNCALGEIKARHEDPSIPDITGATRKNSDKGLPDPKPPIGDSGGQG